MIREDINTLQDIVDIYEKEDTYPLLNDKQVRTIKKVIKTLEQEPFINKPCVSEKSCEHDKNVVLDKIRAEIEQFAELGEVGFTKTLMPKDTVLQIIDKYKTESENT